MSVQIYSRWDPSILLKEVTAETLRSADFRGADIRGADFRGANLRSANFRNANLRGADLRGANLRNANLRDADLRDADLRNANLRDADFRGADLRGALNLSALVAGQLTICGEGDLLVWKKLCDGKLAHLRVPADARRSNSTGRKCRAEYAEVLAIIEADGSAEVEGTSLHDETFVYRVGETVRPSNGWGEDRWEECAPGIHFFLTREEAEDY